MHGIFLHGLGTVDADAGDRNVDVVADHAGDDPGMGTGATAGHDHMVKVEGHLEHLVHDFFHATHIAQGTQRRGSAAGDDVGLSAFGRQLGSHFSMASIMLLPPGTTVMLLTPSSWNRKLLPEASGL